jgi:hypothetical protein
MLAAPKPPAPRPPPPNAPFMIEPYKPPFMMEDWAPVFMDWVSVYEGALKPLVFVGEPPKPTFAGLLAIL